MIAVVKRHSRKGKTMKHFIRYYLAAGLLGMTILFAAGCAGQNNTTYSLKGELPLAEEDAAAARGTNGTALNAGGTNDTALNTGSTARTADTAAESGAPAGESANAAAEIRNAGSDTVLVIFAERCRLRAFMSWLATAGFVMCCFWRAVLRRMPIRKRSTWQQA